MRVTSELGSMMAFASAMLILSTIMALVTAVPIGALVLRYRRLTHEDVSPISYLPDPTVAGALASGRGRQEQAAATVVDLVRKGALRIELGGPNDRIVMIRPCDGARARTMVERLVYGSLAGRAEQGHGIVPVQGLPLLDDLWKRVEDALISEMIDAGLYSRQPARSWTG